MNKFIKIILLFILLTFESYANELQKVSLQLQWLDQFQFAGFYIAKEKGFYKDVGLDVTIKKYTNDIKILENVISGKTTYALGRTSLLIHKNNGVPIVALSAIFQRSPEALLVTNKKIRKARDLVNKRLMISPDALTSASYMSMLFSEGILKKNIIVQQHTFNLDDLIEGKTDAIASYISNEPYQLEKRGIDYIYFHPKDYGFDFYGDLLYTSQEELKNNPKRVEDFTIASLKGWKYAFNNIEETAKLIFKKFNAQNKTLDSLIYEGKVLKKLAFDKNGELGHISQKRIDDIAKTYRLFGLLPHKYSTDNFIKDIHCVSKVELNNEEKKWLAQNPVITLATNKEWNPIEFFNNKGEYSGIASGYLKILEDRLNIKFKIKNGKYWHEMIEDIKKKRVDMFMAIVPTPERKKFMNFTTSYLEFPTVIVSQNKIGYIKDLDELSLKKVAVEKSFYTNELIKSYNKNIQLLEVNTTAEALKLVSNGKAFAYIGALPNIGFFLQKLKLTNLKISGDAPFKTKLSFGAQKDQKQLIHILQKALNDIKPNEHKKIYNQWINITYEHELDYTIILIIATIAFLILTLFYTRNNALKKELLLRERFSSRLKTLNQKLEDKNIVLKELSENDSLTKLANRRKIDTFLEKECERSTRNTLPLSVIMIDIDFFKQINDNYGHKTGDKVLVKLSTILEENVRSYDLVGRWGGEEFIIICPNSSLKQAIKLSKKLCTIIRTTTYESLNSSNITVSCGVTQYKINESIETFIQRADTELYLAKNSGRDAIFPKVL